VSKQFKYLIIVWSLISLSGVSIFLFDALGPAAVPEAQGAIDPVMAVVFWGIMWFIPVVVMAIIGRRQR
jgi:hypothetical protein